MTENPHIYDSSRTLTIKLQAPVSAKLATARRELKPEMTDEEFAAYLLEDHLIALGHLELPKDQEPS